MVRRFGIYSQISTRPLLDDHCITGSYGRPDFVLDSTHAISAMLAETGLLPELTINMIPGTFHGI